MGAGGSTAASCSSLDIGQNNKNAKQRHYRRQNQQHLLLEQKMLKYRKQHQSNGSNDLGNNKRHYTSTSNMKLSSSYLDLTSATSGNFLNGVRELPPDNWPDTSQSEAYSLSNASFGVARPIKVLPSSPPPPAAICALKKSNAGVASRIQRQQQLNRAKELRKFSDSMPSLNNMPQQQIMVKQYEREINPACHHPATSHNHHRASANFISSSQEPTLTGLNQSNAKQTPPACCRAPAASANNNSQITSTHLVSSASGRIDDTYVHYHQQHHHHHHQRHHHQNQKPIWSPNVEPTNSANQLIKRATSLSSLHNLHNQHQNNYTSGSGSNNNNSHNHHLNNHQANFHHHQHRNNSQASNSYSQQFQNKSSSHIGGERLSGSGKQLTVMNQKQGYPRSAFSSSTSGVTCVDQTNKYRSSDFKSKPQSKQHVGGGSFSSCNSGERDKSNGLSSHHHCHLSQPLASAAKKIFRYKQQAPNPSSQSNKRYRQNQQQPSPQQGCPVLPPLPRSQSLHELVQLRATENGQRMRNTGTLRGQLGNCEASGKVNLVVELLESRRREQRLGEDGHSSTLMSQSSSTDDGIHDVSFKTDSRSTDGSRDLNFDCDLELIKSCTRSANVLATNSNNNSGSNHAYNNNNCNNNKVAASQQTNSLLPLACDPKAVSSSHIRQASQLDRPKGAPTARPSKDRQLVSSSKCESNNNWRLVSSALSLAKSANNYGSKQQQQQVNQCSLGEPVGGQKIGRSEKLSSQGGKLKWSPSGWLMNGNSNDDSKAGKQKKQQQQQQQQDNSRKSRPSSGSKLILSSRTPANDDDSLAAIINYANVNSEASQLLDELDQSLDLVSGDAPFSRKAALSGWKVQKQQQQQQKYQHSAMSRTAATSEDKQRDNGTCCFDFGSAVKADNCYSLGDDDDDDDDDDDQDDYASINKAMINATFDVDSGRLQQSQTSSGECLKAGELTIEPPGSPSDSFTFSAPSTSPECSSAKEDLNLNRSTSAGVGVGSLNNNDKIESQPANGSCRTCCQHGQTKPTTNNIDERLTSSNGFRAPMQTSSGGGGSSSSNNNNGHNNGVNSRLINVNGKQEICRSNSELLTSPLGQQLTKQVAQAGKLACSVGQQKEQFLFGKLCNSLLNGYNQNKSNVVQATKAPNKQHILARLANEGQLSLANYALSGHFVSPFVGAPRLGKNFNLASSHSQLSNMDDNFILRRKTPNAGLKSHS